MELHQPGPIPDTATTVLPNTERIIRCRHIRVVRYGCYNLGSVLIVSPAQYQPIGITATSSLRPELFPQILRNPCPALILRWGRPIIPSQHSRQNGRCKGRFGRWLRTLADTE